jgi:asparagine synthase (glutamine-hydrolysing)
MCGIAGIYAIEKNQPISEPLLHLMNRAIAHRGPDGAGIHIEKNVGLAHRRLSIIDVGGGAQPMYNETKSIVVVFNGEIYNYLELKQKLEARGHQFQTNSDTESIIHLYEEKGADCVDDLRGMFALALWDKNSQTLLLARDRLGIKPLYYTIQNGRLLFASEIKAILQDPTVPRAFDLDTLSDYLSFLCIPSPKTGFQGIHKLPAGCRIICRNGNWSLNRYWELKPQIREGLQDERERRDELFELLKRVVRDHLISDVPLGAFLSGGIDSSSIVAFIRRSLNLPISTFTIGFEEGFFDESSFARETARYLGTRHQELTVKPDLVQVLEKLVWHLDEPFADSSAVPTYYVCKMVRDHVTVAISGDGGDELFAGYANYRRGLQEEQWRFIPAPLRSLLIRPLLGCCPEFAKGRTLLTNLLESGQRAYFNKWRYFSASMKEKLLSGDVKRSISTLDSFKTLEPYFQACSEFDLLTQCQYVDVNTYLVDDILTKVDKMSMATSLEVRPPFLDHQVVEYAFSLPQDLKIRKGVSKYLLRKCAEDLLPQEVFHRKKHGFLLPVSTWLRGGLKDYAHDILFDSKSRSRGYFDYRYVKYLWDLHAQDHANRIDISLHLWSLLTLELWHRCFIDQPCPLAK